MSRQFDHNTNKILDFAPKTVFTVYTRRSNCRKKVIYTGTNINKALEVFHGFKVFANDYKYLMYNEAGIDHIIYRNVGEGKRASYQGKHEGGNYKRKRLQNDTIPLSLWQAFEKALVGINLTPQKALPILLASFYRLSDSAKAELIEINMPEVIRQVMLSGGDNTKEIKEYLVAESQAEELL
jgi:hypothetical protein